MGFPAEDEVRERRRKRQRALEKRTTTDAQSRHGKGRTETAVNKLTYGSLLAASLAYLMIRQQDAVGLCVFDDEVRTLIPHRSVRRQLFYILQNLEEIAPGEKTSISPALHKIAERMKRRGLIILISDLMDDPDKLITGLKHFRHRQHEVIVFHVLDPREVDLSYKGEVELEDLESGRKLRLAPAFLREQYSRDVADWIDKLNRNCRDHQIDYNLLRTDTPYDQALTSYLGKRQRMG
jgi:uncharacterized protein (DUF58 family)